MSPFGSSRLAYRVLVAKKADFLHGLGLWNSIQPLHTDKRFGHFRVSRSCLKFVCGAEYVHRQAVPGASEICERLLDDPEFGLAGLSPLVISSFIPGEHSIILFVIARASKFEHVVGFINFPPCPGSLESYVTDEFVGAFDSPASDGISATSGFPVIQAVQIVGKI